MLEFLELWKFEIIGTICALALSITMGWLVWWSFQSPLDLALAKKEYAVYDRVKNQMFYTVNPGPYKYDTDYEVLGQL